MINHWFHDHAFKRLVKNASIVISGDSVGLGLQLAALSMTARMLGAEQLGLLVLINTYANIIDRLVNFQSWQALIKYGAGCFRNNDTGDFRALIRFGFTIDAATALLGAVIAGIGIAIWAYVKGWDGHLMTCAVLYTGVILFRIAGAPIAIIRLYDHFKYLSAQKVLQGLLKVGGVAIAGFISRDLGIFLLVWAVADIGGSLLLILLSLYVLHSKNIANVFSAPLRGVTQRFPGVVKFVFVTNMDGIVRVFRELDVFIVERFLGVGAVAFYHIARKLTAVIAKVSDSFYTAVYPELATMSADRDHAGLGRLTFRSSIMLGTMNVLVCVAFVLFGQTIIDAVFGNAFIQSYGVAIWCMIAMVIWGFAQPLSPALLALGRAATIYWIHLFSTSAYLALLVVFLRSFGLVGAGIALTMFYGVWSFCMLAAMLQAQSKSVWISN